MKRRMHLVMMTMIMVLSTANSSAKIVVGQKSSEQRLLLTMADGSNRQVSLPIGVKPSLPMTYTDVATGQELKLTVKDVKRLELATMNEAVDGVRAWEVRPVAIPSLLQGKRHREQRLCGIVERTDQGTVYTWEIPVKQSETARQVGTERWYGVEPAGSSVVYSFIHNSKAWLRDVKLVLGTEAPDFVKRVQTYYIKVKQSQREERWQELEKRPQSILQIP